MSILQINTRLSQNKTLIWRFTKVISKVGLDNEIQPPEDRDAIGKLSNKNNEIIIIDNTCISKYCANSRALSTSRKKTTNEL